MKEIMKETPEFKKLQAEVHDAYVAYAEGADFISTVVRLAAIGERMSALLA